MLDSLVRVSRRGKENHFASITLASLSPDQDKTRAVFSPKWTYLPHGHLSRPKPMLAHVNPQRPRCKQREKNGKTRHWFPSLPFQQFQVLFNSLFKVLFIFPSRYLFAIGLPPIFSFRWNLPPTLSCNPKQLDSSKACVNVARPRQGRECHPLSCLFPKDLARDDDKHCFCRPQLGTRSFFIYDGVQIHTVSTSRFSRPY